MRKWIASRKLRKATLSLSSFLFSFAVSQIDRQTEGKTRCCCPWREKKKKKKRESQERCYGLGDSNKAQGHHGRERRRVSNFANLFFHRGQWINCLIFINPPKKDVFDRIKSLSFSFLRKPAVDLHQGLLTREKSGKGGGGWEGEEEKSQGGVDGCVTCSFLSPRCLS